MLRRPMPTSPISSATSASSRRRRLKGVLPVSQNGIVTITSFNGGCNGSTNYPPDHVWRRRHAAVAGLAGGEAETISAAVRGAFDISGYTAPGVGGGPVRAT